MPAFLNWLLRLIPTNPICLRLVQGGSKRLRHLYIRSGYLAIMIVVLLFVLLSRVSGQALSMRALAAGGAEMFEYVSYLQIGLICLLTPVFMAGAIAQEANPRTWDILLTTPLSNLQIVLGNLFGRLFFVLALLFSSLPLFAVMQYFGGVPGDSILASYAIAGTSSLLVAAIAVTLSVTRTAGQRAVFVFYVTVVMYLFITYAIDLYLRQPIGIGIESTTFMTPLNPFLALEVLLKSNAYVPTDPIDLGAAPWLLKMWFSQPIATFCWLCVGLSLFLVVFSTVRLRVIGAKTGSIPWYRKMLGLAARDATERPGRTVAHNPIAWRESVARGKTLAAMLGRWGFVGAGVILAISLITLYHTGLWTADELRLAIAATVAAEIVITALVALNMSATAVSREREDGTLDLILTTPIQPGPYLAGKLRGLVQYLAPMMLVPTFTLMAMSVYVLAGGFGREGGVQMTNVAIPGTATTIDLPLILPEAAIALPLVLAPFIAFCVMVGLHWSIKSKGTIGSVIATVALVVAVVGVLSLCGFASGRSIPMLGAVFSMFSPINLVFSVVFPEDSIGGSLREGLGPTAVSILIGAAISAAGYAAVVYGMHANMKRTFMMTVRKLAGTN